MSHTQEEWQEIINTFTKSGLSQRKWCKLHNEDRNRLCYWILRFREIDEGKDVLFAEVKIGGEKN